VLTQSHALDQIGVFTRSVEDAALMAEQMMAFDVADPDLVPRARPRLLEACIEEPPLRPRLAFVKTPAWDEYAETDTKEAFAELVGHLDQDAAEVTLPPVFDKIYDVHRTVMESDIAKAYAAEYERGKDQLSDVLRGILESGQRHLAVDYNRARDHMALYNDLLDEIFQSFDAIITPATCGEAPLGLDSTGSPIFCTVWTFCGTPAITIPVLQGSNAMPLGVQVVGPKGDDARLLRTARWLVDRIEAA
jgi:Asp-tRNA(Asn)/Glu-tRNA(Gln) amidotransferase A subunit family amidase